MLFLPEAAGPHDPVPVTIERRAGSIRRTSNIDSARPDGLRGDVAVSARARDLRTALDGTSTVVGEVELRARIDGRHQTLRSIVATPARPELEGLLGCLVGPGFRSKVAQIVPEERDAGTLLHLLLDDLPGATLVSGYAVQRARALDRSSPPDASNAETPDTARILLAQDDLCAGWAHDATMMASIRSTGVIPVPMGPLAPVLERSDDQLGWHAIEPLMPHAMRRRRRLDVVAPVDPETAHHLDVHFRDSHIDDAGVESVVHEYSVTGRADIAGGRVVDVVAEARVLPWMECPGALASADRLAGMPITELRTRVRRELTGRSSCTHLNDTLRSLGDVTVLVEELAEG